ncbi:MAG TPA: GNAT family N-acetyltransferase [Terracidiphilus sp.]|nr:GNAT family N-acetyltransferase [Terracidiphilus sp.]
MEFGIRRATIEDSRAIARVQVESWKTTYAGIVPHDYLAAMDVELRMERWREAFAIEGMILLVAEDASGIFGFASGGKLREPMQGYDSELFAIYLLKQQQGTGTGRRLFEEQARLIAGAGYKAMALWVLRKNPAVGFYQHMGGIEVGQKKIEIGGELLDEVAFGWPKLDGFTGKAV